MQNERIHILISIFRLTRIWNLIILAGAQLFAAYYLIGLHSVIQLKLLLLVFSTGLITAAGYSINNYFDVKIDLINEPDQVVVGRAFTRRKTIFLHFVLSVTGIAIGFFLNWKLGCANLGASLVLWFYSSAFKRIPFMGNFSIATLTALSILILIFVYPVSLAGISMYSTFAFVITLIRESVKDMEDLTGDKTYGRRTIPVVLGISKTKIYSGTLILILMTAIWLAYFLYQPMPVPVILGLIMLPLAIFTFLLIKADTILEFSRLSRLAKLLMVLGIISMAFFKYAA
jgi:4-hydroxybenzoate polyprenyltransferase